jgi:hypothetical protein
VVAATPMRTLLETHWGVCLLAWTFACVAGCGGVQERPGPASNESRAVASPSADSLRAAPPVLRTGDRWKYQYSIGEGRRRTFMQQVHGRETVDGVDCYVLSTGAGKQGAFRVADMAMAESREDGAPLTRYRPPLEMFRWPLHVGLSWSQSIRAERARDDATHDLTNECSVVGDEAITVPAGTFRTLKIECRQNGRQVVEAWYSPDVRNLVRSRRTRRDGLETRELVEYRLED